MGKVRDHYGSQGDRNLHLPVRGHNLPHGRPCAHGCHKILTNWRLAEAAAAREVLHALGYPHISERVSPRGTRCAHPLTPKHWSQTSNVLVTVPPGDLRENPGSLREESWGGYMTHCLQRGRMHQHTGTRPNYQHSAKLPFITRSASKIVGRRAGTVA